MLPTNRPLSGQEIDAVRAAFRQFLREERVTIGDVAKGLGKGFSEATLSQFKNGYAKSSGEKVARAVNQWMEQYAGRVEIELPTDFVETDVAKRILTVADLAIKGGVMGEVIGPSGVGKTKTAEALERIYPGSILIRVNQSTRRNTGVTMAIARKLGVDRRRDVMARMWTIVESLRGSNRPIFIDEAHELSETGAKAIRDIHDETGCPIVLFGTIDLRKIVDDSQRFYGQFNSRIGPRTDVTELANRSNRPKPLFSVDEIVALFQSGKVKLSSDGAAFLADLACIQGLGSLRLCAQLMRLATPLAKRKGSPITRAMLVSIMKQMHGTAWTSIVQRRRDQLPVLAKVG